PAGVAGGKGGAIDDGLFATAGAEDDGSFLFAGTRENDVLGVDASAHLDDVAGARPGGGVAEGFPRGGQRAGGGVVAGRADDVGGGVEGRRKQAAKDQEKTDQGSGVVQAAEEEGEAVVAPAWADQVVAPCCSVAGNTTVRGVVSSRRVTAVRPMARKSKLSRLRPAWALTLVPITARRPTSSGQERRALWRS